MSTERARSQPTPPDASTTDGPRRSGLVQERSRRTRQELVTAALRLWTQRGFEHGVRDTTVEEIVREAGVTKGTFYFHVAHKEDILLELGWATSEALQKDARRIVEADTPVEQALDQVLSALARRITSTPRTVVGRSLLEFYRQRSAELDAAGAQHGFQNAFLLVFAHARDTGEIPADSDPRKLASMLLWLVFGCMNVWIGGGDDRDVGPEMCARGRFVLAGVRALRTE